MGSSLYSRNRSKEKWIRIHFTGHSKSKVTDLFVGRRKYRIEEGLMAELEFVGDQTGRNADVMKGCSRVSPSPLNNNRGETYFLLK